MTVMAALAKVMLMTMLLVVPGGLVLAAAYFLARAVHHSWLVDNDRAGFARARHAVTQIRFRDVWREARAAF
jgi:hypothetical protein